MRFSKASYQEFFGTSEVISFLKFQAIIKPLPCSDPMCYWMLPSFYVEIKVYGRFQGCEDIGTNGFMVIYLQY